MPNASIREDANAASNLTITNHPLSKVLLLQLLLSRNALAAGSGLHRDTRG